MVLILLADKCDITAAQYCISMTELYVVATGDTACIGYRPQQEANVAGRNPSTMWPRPLDHIADGLRQVVGWQNFLNMQRSLLKLSRLLLHEL